MPDALPILSKDTGDFCLSADQHEFMPLSTCTLQEPGPYLAIEYRCTGTPPHQAVKPAERRPVRSGSRCEPVAVGLRPQGSLCCACAVVHQQTRDGNLLIARGHPLSQPVTTNHSLSPSPSHPRSLPAKRQRHSHSFRNHRHSFIRNKVTTGTETF